MKPNERKAGISGPFSRLLGSLAERMNGWLTWEGSNSHMKCRGNFPSFPRNSSLETFAATSCELRIRLRKYFGLSNAPFRALSHKAN